MPVQKEAPEVEAPEVFVVVNRSGRPITFGDVLLIPGEEVRIGAELFELINGNSNIHEVKAK